jgi:hypothetical protein
VEERGPQLVRAGAQGYAKLEISLLFAAWVYLERVMQMAIYPNRHLYQLGSGRSNASHTNPDLILALDGRPMVNVQSAARG